MARGAGALDGALARIRMALGTFEARVTLMREWQRFLPGLRCHTE
jgi:hypothetical protein